MNIPPIEIYQAKKRISPYVTRTPLVRAHALSDRCEAEIWCKLETIQPTGAFKLRGATNAILRLNEDQRNTEWWPFPQETTGVVWHTPHVNKVSGL